MSRMFWQRCSHCGRLNLARLGSTAHCDCGAGASPGAAPKALGAPPSPPSLPAGPAPSSAPGDYAGLPRTDAPAAPAPTPRQLTLITPEQDAAARKLLVSALGEEWTF